MKLREDSKSESAFDHIRKSSLFPHRIRESNVRALLNRVEHIETNTPMETTTHSLSVSQQTMIDRLIEKTSQDRPRDAAPFNVVDLGDIIRQHLRWTSLLPTVHPFYAVKCNPDPMILALLDALGASFDCASQSEFELLLANGVQIEGGITDKVVFSHPCKHPLHLAYAQQIGVNLCTFDNEWEIEKIARLHPHCKSLLRIQVDDSRSKMKFNSKYGFKVEDRSEVDRIFELCRKFNIDLKGIMFHVGSGCRDSLVYGTAVEQSKFLFDVAHSKFGYDPATMDTLDLGGGFPGLEPFDPMEGGDDDSRPSFEEMAQQINQSLVHHFGDIDSGYRFIAEPGRYYVAKSHSLVCEVIAKKKREDGLGFVYYLNDGIFGAFNIIHWEQSQPLLLPHQKTLQRKDNGEVLYPSTIFGPTCESLDKMYDDYPLRELNIMDKVVVPHFGAYTGCLATGFNGFERPKPHYIMTL